MHGEHIGFGQSPTVAFSYLIVAATLLVCAKYAVVASTAPEHGEAHAAMPAPAK